MDPGFVPDTGKLKKSPIEMASEKNQEIFLLLTKKKLFDLMHQDDKETAKEEFAKLLKTIPSKLVRFYFYQPFLVHSLRLRKHAWANTKELQS